MSDCSPADPPTGSSLSFAEGLERLGLQRLPARGFRLTAEEARLIDPALAAPGAKNISFDGASVRGAAGDAAAAARIAGLLSRYRAWACTTLLELAPRYETGLETGRTSLRLREVAEPAISPRKDDRRLHVDAFASQPTGGRRILRVFVNINPHGQARLWRVGEPFEDHARRFAPRARDLLPLEGALLEALRITRARRTAYDQLMLQIHDRAKLDTAYQTSDVGHEERFAPGEAWIVYTDSLVHAALAGRFALEQTFYLPLSAMAAPEAAPARILEAVKGRRLLPA